MKKIIQRSVFRKKKMKRSQRDSSSSLPSKNPKSTERAACTGVRYLGKQAMLLNDSDLVPKFEETNMTDWEVIVPPYVLPDALQQDLRAWSKKFDKQGAITFHILFPNDYPRSVPFVRVVRPRFKYHTGHVTLGGSICNEMLTPAGWREMNVESLIYAVLGILQDGKAARFRCSQTCTAPLLRTIITSDSHGSRTKRQRERTDGKFRKRGELTDFHTVICYCDVLKKGH
jgi:hypothetical protein